MEYCDGRTLAEASRDGVLGRRGSPDIRKLLHVLRGVAAGLAYLHTQGVVRAERCGEDSALTYGTEV